LVNNNDVAVHVPPEIVPVRGFHYYLYKHVGTLKYFDRHGILDEGTSEWDIKKNLIHGQLLRLGQPPTQWWQDHLLDNYIEVIRKNR
jgi:hypothetical protein